MCQQLQKRKLNAVGLSKFWESVNDAFQAWDKEQMRSTQNVNTGFKKHHYNQCRYNRVEGKSRQFEFPHGNSDRYHWHASDTRRCLPKLPK